MSVDLSRPNAGRVYDYLLGGKHNFPADREFGEQIKQVLPGFDVGAQRGRQSLCRAVNRLAETAINARSEVRQAYLNYRMSYDIARHYRDEIVPIRKRISEENLLRYNGMLIGVFELLADARSQIAGVNGYIDALRDFWLAQADLEMSLIGRPDLRVTPATPSRTLGSSPEH